MSRSRPPHEHRQHEDVSPVPAVWGGASSRYPRALVISPNPVNPIDGGGVMMANLFAGWPPDRLADIFSQQGAAPSKEICANAYRLCPRITRHPSEWARRAFGYARGDYESLDGIASLRLTRRLTAWIDDFAPEVIYSHLGPLWLTRLTNIIATRRGIPLVAHVMDDYIVDWPVSGIRTRNIFPVAQILHRLNHRAFLRSLQLATVRLVISAAMQEEYERRYACGFSVVHNGIDPRSWPETEIRPVTPDRAFRVMFSGSVTPNTNAAGLLDLASAIASLGAAGDRVELEITRPNDPALAAQLGRPPFVRLVERVPHREMPGKLAEADLLAMPFNFDKGSARFIRYSWPTKVSEFMASGRPILVYGPREAAIVRDAEGEQWARAVVRRDREALEGAIRELATDHGLRQRIGARARSLALERYDLPRIRTWFQSALCSAASGRVEAIAP